MVIVKIVIYPYTIIFFSRKKLKIIFLHTIRNIFHDFINRSIT